MARGTRSRRARLSISREAVDEGFAYRLRGRLITSKREIARIEKLAIPPAWTDVEISRSPSAKILARGTDAAGRTQAIYHPAFRRKQERAKFDRLQRFAERLPELRSQVERDLRRRRPGRDKVVACVVTLLDRHLLRVGNHVYAERHRSYGATTLRRKHVRTTSTKASFDFIGKSGKRHRIEVRDPRMARILGELRDAPGYEVFRFIDDEGSWHDVNSRHVNAYVKRYAGEEFSAKDFRTWGGTVLAAAALLEETDDGRDGGADRADAARRVVKQVAERLGNTPEVTRSSYIDPRILAAYERGDAFDRVRAARKRMRPRRYLSVDEQCTLRLLRTDIDG
ncbi:DNA topoisomerase IB [Leucobacter sp. CSA1]|uniref:DNA topoisomerase n=1 Tax=Leucobacter chromiisoli TaxID=2796471 RepID=A0A934Q8M3_9MICO|nr:DNA topoisomerase IB [Leucobacter chromiisoli]MBK0419131.1 DNA topoisomerase IB [Leucobacter chromiisoli]